MSGILEMRGDWGHEYTPTRRLPDTYKNRKKAAKGLEREDKGRHFWDIPPPLGTFPETHLQDTPNINPAHITP